MSNSLSFSVRGERRAFWPLMIGTGCALAGIILLVWRSALQGDFHFDDYGAIVQNRAIRSLWPLDAFLQSGRPLGLYTFALNYHFSDLDPTAYRLTNVLVHATNVVLLCVGIQLSGTIIDRRNGSPLDQPATTSLLFATIVALMWGLHPLTTQAVTNIVQRYESIATLGYLGAWIGVLLVIERKRAGYILILLFAWIGMLSKEIFATAPLVILLFDSVATGWTWRSIFSARWLAYLLMVTPFVWFVPSVLRWFDPSRSSSMGFGLKTVSPWEYLRTQPEVLFRYLQLSLWPVDLCFDYTWHVQDNPFVYVPLGILILSMLVTGAWLYWRGLNSAESSESSIKSQLVPALAGWLILTFFLILGPTSSFIPIADLCVEHRMYLPLAILMCGICLIGRQAWRQLEANVSRSVVVRSGLALMLSTCLVLLGWRTELRNRDYQDGIRLWMSTVKLRPDNPRAWFMLGSEYYGRNQLQQALRYYEHAIRFQAPVGEFHAGLADCLREMGRPEEALAQYQRAIELKPALAQAHNGLGVLHHRRGNLQSARDAFQQAYELDLPEARYNLASVLIELGEFASAVPLLEASLAEHPEFSLPARRLAWILATSPTKELRDGPRARELLDAHFQIAESDSPYVWDTHAAVLAEQRQFADAERAAERAVELAEARKDSQLTALIQDRLKCYRQQRPWREEVRP